MRKSKYGKYSENGAPLHKAQGSSAAVLALLGSYSPKEDKASGDNEFDVFADNTTYIFDRDTPPRTAETDAILEDLIARISLSDDDSGLDSDDVPSKDAYDVNHPSTKTNGPGLLVTSDGEPEPEFPSIHFMSRRGTSKDNDYDLFGEMSSSDSEDDAPQILAGSEKQEKFGGAPPDDIASEASRLSLCAS